VNDRRVATRGGTTTIEGSRVLIVEDYAPIRESVSQGLIEAGFAVDSASDGIAGMELATSKDYALVILDLMLPGLDGMDVLTRLRGANHEALVLILSAKGRLSDRIEGLNHGADDYLVKPFALAELLERVRALMRRRSMDPAEMIYVDDLVINTAARTVRRGELEIDVTAREYAFLELLARNAGSVVTRDQLQKHVYGSAAGSRSNVVDVYIGYLRTKMERAGRPRLLHTVRGAGYLLGARS
jgi:DNA-binding response OmpR family regulator